MAEKIAIFYSAVLKFFTTVLSHCGDRCPLEDVCYCLVGQLLCDTIRSPNQATLCHLVVHLFPHAYTANWQSWYCYISEIGTSGGCIHVPPVATSLHLVLALKQNDINAKNKTLDMSAFYPNLSYSTQCQISGPSQTVTAGAGTPDRFSFLISLVPIIS
jgi:hypothetical protein